MSEAISAFFGAAITSLVLFFVLIILWIIYLYLSDLFNPTPISGTSGFLHSDELHKYELQKKERKRLREEKRRAEKIRTENKEESKKEKPNNPGRVYSGSFRSSYGGSRTRRRKCRYCSRDAKAGSDVCLSHYDSRHGGA